MGMDKIEIPRADELFKSPVGARDRPRLFGMQRQRDLRDALCGKHIGINPAVGGKRDPMPHTGKRTAQLQNMGFRPADVHCHGDHKYFHKAPRVSM